MGRSIGDRHERCEILLIDDLGSPTRQAGERTKRVQPTRVLLAGMTRMLTDIVKGIIASQADFDLAGEIIGEDGLLLQAATDAEVDVMVVGPLLVIGSNEYHHLLYGRPRMKIVAIAADGREAALHELQPHVIPLGEVSPASLITAIRSASHPAGANTSRRVRGND